MDTRRSGNMKKLLCFIAISYFVLSPNCFAWPWSKPDITITSNVPPPPKPVTVVKHTTTVQRVDQAALIAKIKDLLAQQMIELKAANASSAEALKERDAAQQQVNAIGKQRDQWEVFGRAADVARQKALLQVASGKAAILRRDIIIGVLGLLIGAFVFLKLFMKASLFGL
jgi:hypothetical protein